MLTIQNGIPYPGSYPWYQAPQQTQPVQQPVQAPMQPQPAHVVPGRIVKNPNEIRPNEVPMDGSPSYFPTDDEQYIFVKQWNSDGTIRTVKFAKCADEVPIIEPPVDNSAAILERLDKIEKILSSKKTKKEDAE